MEHIDLTNLTEAEEELRRDVEHGCAHAVAFEVRQEGVRSVEIDPAGLEVHCYPHRTHRPLVCMLAGPAWDVMHGDEATADEVETMLSGEEPILDNLQQARLEAHYDGELEEAWAEAQEFVEGWSDVIEHAATALMTGYRQEGDSSLPGGAIRERVNDASLFGLETPRDDS